MEAIHRTGSTWSELDRLAVEHVVASSSKRRHQLEGDRVRALNGHSLPVLAGKVAAVPPVQFHHETSPAAWSEICGVGLAPTGRQYIHLSTDIQTALAVGQQTSSSPMTLRVDSVAAHTRGVAFHEGNEMVCLADFVPAKFIAVVDNPGHAWRRKGQGAVGSRRVCPQPQLVRACRP